MLRAANAGRVGEFSTHPGAASSSTHASQRCCQAQASCCPTARTTASGGTSHCKTGTGTRERPSQRCDQAQASCCPTARTIASGGTNDCKTGTGAHKRPSRRRCGCLALPLQPLAGRIESLPNLVLALCSAHLNLEPTVKNQKPLNPEVGA